METIAQRAPATGAVLKTYPVTDSQELQAAVARARRASGPWGELPVRARCDALQAIVGALLGDLQGVVQCLCESTGKVPLEALAGDVLTTVELGTYYGRHAEELLAPERRGHSALFAGSEFTVEHRPLGVVAVLAPWNFPLQLALVPALTALVAGNTVVLKPSELVPAVGALITDLVRRAGLPEGVLEVVQGGTRVGEALVRSRPDKVFVTGSTATGRKVLAAAAEALVPVDLELGGKDAMIVFADAAIERAVAGATWGAFSNAGQVCVSVERLFVERAVHDGLVQGLVRAAGALRVGEGWAADLGPLVQPGLADRVEAQVKDALAKGALCPTGFRREGDRMWPVVLTDVDDTMAVLSDETFGPVLPVARFEGEDDAVAKANASPFGLNASVWTRDLERGKRVARRLRTGSAAVNDVLKNIGNPATPFGGVGASGFGRYHGPEGLWAFTRTQSLMVSRGLLPREPNWFPYTRATYEGLAALLHALHGPGDTLAKARRWWATRPR